MTTELQEKLKQVKFVITDVDGVLTDGLLHYDANGEALKSFHVRDGAPDQPSVWDDFWPIFDNFHGLRGVLHSFTDTRLNLDKGFARRLYVGLNGISTFTKDQAQRELFASIPLERLLLETDAPFLTPKPFRGKLNKPEYVELVAKYWAAERKLVLRDLEKAATDNTVKLFGL